jgi:thiol-disulfide isomerase/thioredoxin
MKHLQLLPAYLFLFLFFSNCTSDPTQKGETTQNVAQIDSIEVNYPWTPDPKNEADGLFVCYFDEFGQYFLNPGINKIPNNVFLRNAHWKSSAFLPIINFKFKAIKIDSSQGIIQFKTGNIKTDNFIGFYSKYRQNEDPIRTFKDILKVNDYVLKSFANNPDAQLVVIEKDYQKRINYLTKYAKEYKLDSNEVNQWKEILLIEKLSHRLSIARFANKKWTKQQVESLTQLVPILQNGEKYISFPEYHYGARHCLEILRFAQTGNLKPDFKVDFAIIGDNFREQTRDLLLTYLMIDEGKKLSKTDFEYYQNRYLSICKTQRYADYFQKSVMPMNDKISATSLYDVNKKLVDFKEITSKNKLTYVDFWASWCAPCRAEMPDSKKLRDEYASKGVNFVYISTDENAADWDKANKKIGLPDNMSFLLPNPSENPLKKQFKITAIPRYMLIDKNGKVIDDDAPRPSDKEIRGVLDELLK